jgi:prepilin-type N-terminal cleavage/methylation domain-containing protein
MNRIRMRARGGMTLMEVMVATVILTSVLLALGVFAAKHAREVGTSTVRANARELVSDRLEYVKGATRNDNIETVYGGTETSIPSYPNFTRQTLVVRQGGGPADLYDHKVVTVIVNAPALSKPAKKTTIISAF